MYINNYSLKKNYVINDITLIENIFQAFTSKN